MLILVRKQFGLFKKLLLTTILIQVCSYSVYLFGEEIVISAGEEDGLFENLTAIFFFLVSIVFGFLYFSSRNIFFLILSMVFFIGCGEEVSWGQRIFDIDTPEQLKNRNVQGEITLHNLEIFNAHDFDAQQKRGWKKLLTINFLYKLFCMAFGAALPIVAYYLRSINKLISKIKLPVPPILLGIIFPLNWILFRLILNSLPGGGAPNYYYVVGEICEFVSAVIFLMIALAYVKTNRGKLANQNLLQA